MLLIYLGLNLRQAREDNQGLGSSRPPTTRHIERIKMREEPIKHSEEHLKQMQVEAYAYRLQLSFNMTVEQSLKEAKKAVNWQRAGK